MSLLDLPQSASGLNFVSSNVPKDLHRRFTGFEPLPRKQILHQSHSERLSWANWTLEQLSSSIFRSSLGVFATAAFLGCKQRGRQKRLRASRLALRSVAETVPETVSETVPESKEKPCRPCFETLDLKEGKVKGLGVLATSDIKRGQLILSEEPILKFRSSDPVWLCRIRKMVRDSPQKRKALSSLYDAFRRETGGKKSLRGVVQTNAFRCGMKTEYYVLGIQASRFNHSCNSNCEQSYDEELNQLQFYASTDIEAGQELCIRYIDTRAPYEVRQEELESLFGFKCRCEVCAEKDEGEREQQDAYREEMQELLEDLEEHDEGYGVWERPEKVLDTVESLLDLYDKANLHAQSYRKWDCTTASEVSDELGDERGARAYLKQAIYHATLLQGANHQDTRELKEKLEPWSLLEEVEGGFDIAKEDVAEEDRPKEETISVADFLASATNDLNVLDQRVEEALHAAEEETVTEEDSPFEVWRPDAGDLEKVKASRREALNNAAQEKSVRR
eukprot:TRINITY_DN1922_c1_g2_i1.p1 TRINITY_DN1922_c1_g2~~TRINITY_DN1922_c1_g2_i1.p1  ORF type:complete len:505 (+),score=84.69 TRINITY_DN1922_c1_g2_i1:100-1614(+)